MHGSLALSHGVLWVGRAAKTAVVRAHDLDGHPLETSFEFRDERRGRSNASGLDVDADRRVWVADAAAGRLRAFTLFGRQVVDLGGADEDRLDVRGALGDPVDVRTRGEDDDLELLVASGGRRRYALQVFRAHESRVRVLPPLGDTEGCFDDLAGVHWDAGEDGDDDVVVACERRRERLQVFRDGRFHFALRMPGPPEAAVVLPGGRLLVALGAPVSAVVLFRADGRPLRTVAGADELREPSDLAWLPGDGPGDEDLGARVWVIDREGTRVQVFTVDGRSWGAFPAV